MEKIHARASKTFSKRLTSTPAIAAFTVAMSAKAGIRTMSLAPTLIHNAWSRFMDLTHFSNDDQIGSHGKCHLSLFVLFFGKLSARLRTAQRLNRDRDIGVGWLLSGLLSGHC